MAARHTPRMPAQRIPAREVVDEHAVALDGRHASVPAAITGVLPATGLLRPAESS
jgi:hypothetical protein